MIRKLKSQQLCGKKGGLTILWQRRVDFFFFFWRGLSCNTLYLCVLGASTVAFKPYRYNVAYMSKKKRSQEMQAPSGQNQTGWKPRPKPRNRPECVHSQGKAGPAEQDCSLSPRDQRRTPVRADKEQLGSQQPKKSSCASSPALSASKPSAFLPVSRERLPQLQIPAETLWSTTKGKENKKSRLRYWWFTRPPFKVRVDLYSRICLPCSGEWQLEDFLQCTWKN